MLRANERKAGLVAGGWGAGTRPLALSRKTGRKADTPHAKAHGKPLSPRGRGVGERGRAALALAVGLLLAAQAHAATLVTAAQIHPVSGPAIENGQMLIDEGRIVAIGADLSAQAAGAERVDYPGHWIVPAFVTANTVMGLVEIETVRGSVDLAETGAINPNARAEVAINPDSELLPVARANGVLYAHVVPQAGQGGVIAGSSALIRMDGWTYEDMTVEAPVGIHLMWPGTRLPPWLPAAMREEALKGAERSREAIAKAFDDAAAWRTARDAGTLSGRDGRLEALAGVLDGKTRLYIHALEARQIREALDFTAARGLSFTLVGGQDAWRYAEPLKARGVGVILHSPYDLPLRRHEGHDATFANAAKLHAAGIPFAIASDGTSFAATLERNLPYSAAQAVSHGLPWDEGLKSITLAPAQLLGVSDRIGSLEPGKAASFVVTNGDPLEVKSRVVAAWLDGRSLDLSSRHTRLRDKYEGKYREP